MSIKTALRSCLAWLWRGGTPQHGGHGSGASYFHLAPGAWPDSGSGNGSEGHGDAERRYL